MKLLTQSRMRAWRECARLERAQYIDGWRPVVEEEALSFGRLWHLAMDVRWECVREKVEFSTDDVDTFATADPFIAAKARAMVTAYHARWMSDYEDYEVAGVEDEFRAPLLNPSTWAASRTWTLAGRIDKRVIVHDGGPHDNRRAIVEHKTSSEDITPGSDYWAKLHMDHQVSIYMIGAESLGWAPEECLYDVALKPALRPLKATPEEARKYTKDGKLYAAQRESDETPEEYGARCAAAIAENPERYFQRQFVPRTESQIKEFLTDAWQQGRVMHEAHLASHAPRNPEACHRFGRCFMWDACAAGLNPEDHPERFVRAEWVHPELTNKEGENGSTSNETE